MRGKKREYTAEEMAALTVPTDAEIRDLTKKLERVLHGENPLLVGIVLADVVAMYFAGHHPALRDDSVDIWVKTMQSLIDVDEKELLDIHGWPPGWRRDN